MYSSKAMALAVSFMQPSRLVGRKDKLYGMRRKQFLYGLSSRKLFG